MILDMLQNSTFMFFFIITFVIFLILYMWRKIASLESYVYILEKRLNLMKKDINNKNYCENNVDENCLKCPLSPDEKCKTDEEMNDIIMNEVFGGNDMMFNTNTNTNTNTKVEIETYDLPVATAAIKIEDNNNEESDDDIVEQEYEMKEMKEMKEMNEIEDVLDKVLDNDKNIVFEVKKEEQKPDTKDVSTTGLTRNKLIKMSLGDLKELCVLNNISTEGTKPTLINNLLRV